MRAAVTADGATRRELGIDEAGGAGGGLNGAGVGHLGAAATASEPMGRTSRYAMPGASGKGRYRVIPGRSSKSESKVASVMPGSAA